jgi:DNA adenine methylase
MSLGRPVLRYHGGKWKLAEWIIEHMPPHRIYCEPFGGGGSVLMRKPRSYAEVYNDQWATVVNVFRVLRDETQACELIRALELTPYARDEFFAAYHEEGDSPVEWARKTILRSFAGFGSAATNGDYITGFRANSNRSGTTPAHDWVNYPSHIPAFVERLRGVVIENRDAVDVIAQQDSPGTLFYVDPPYPHDTRNMKRGNAAYAVEMTDEDHVRLAGVLHAVRGMVLLSSYHGELYDSLYRDWMRHECGAHADGAVDRVEVLWMNEAAATQQRQHRLIA